MSMYPRLLSPPKRSFFLFGPRAVGKSTWLRQHFAEAETFNLLELDVRLRFLRDPSAFRQRVQALRPGSWVVVDEVQLAPALLSEVHSLIESDRYKFAMSGSSARKIRRGEANLLAGRAILRNMFPLTLREISDDAKLGDLFASGCLPLVVDADDEEKGDLLEAYAMTYLREEIQAEALVRNLASFSRFLECAALSNGQVTNVSALARDAGVQRPTVQGYFQILQDTLIGHLLPAWRPRARIKEQAHPKFYWFDPGVARAMAGRVWLPVETPERGPLLETYIYHELRAHLHYEKVPGTLAYWRTPAGNEVDFVWTAPHACVAIEIKASRRWRHEFRQGLDALGEAVPHVKKIGVYLGDEPLSDAGLHVYPLRMFLSELYAGKVLS
jgi:predicted AAA+ superfamily ATPase